MKIKISALLLCLALLLSGCTAGGDIFDITDGKESSTPHVTGDINIPESETEPEEKGEAADLETIKRPSARTLKASAHTAASLRATPPTSRWNISRAPRMPAGSTALPFTSRRSQRTPSIPSRARSEEISSLTRATLTNLSLSCAAFPLFAILQTPSL